MRLDVERGEYSDSDQNAMLKMFDLGKGLATGQPPDVGEKGTIEPADAGAGRYACSRGAIRVS